MGSIREKLRALWEDKRSWKVRLPLAILSPFAFVFTFILFGPCEIFIQNMQEMPFPFLTLAPALLLAGGAVFGALLLALLLLRGKLFNLAVSLLFAGTLAGYLQGNFLNIERGSLDGSAVYLGGEGWAAEFWVRDGYIVQFTLRFRSYAANGRQALLLPIDKAAAMLPDYTSERRELAVQYRDGGGTEVSPDWVAA